MKQFLENIVKNIVENPTEVAIAESTDDKDRLVFTISVADTDMGRIIGKDGKVINAIRMIMRVMAIRQDVRVRIDIEDKNQPEAPAVQPVTEAAPAPAVEEVSTPVQAQPAQPQAPTAAPAQAPTEPTAADIVGGPTPVAQPPVTADAAVQEGTTLVDNSQNAA